MGEVSKWRELAIGGGRTVRRWTYTLRTTRTRPCALWARCNNDSGGQRKQRARRRECGSKDEDKDTDGRGRWRSKSKRKEEEKGRGRSGAFCVVDFINAVDLERGRSLGRRTGDGISVYGTKGESLCKQAAV